MKRWLAALIMTLVAAGSLLLAAPTFLVDRIERESPGVLFSVRTERPLLALTIDDGPSENTAEILDVLERYGARATFFLIGSHVRARPDAVRRIVEAGHEIGNHMMEDEPSIRLEPAEFTRQLGATDSLLSEFADPHWFRPGSGWYDDEMVDRVEAAGYRLVLGSMWPIDPYVSFAPAVSQYAHWHARPGAILILHDSPDQGSETAEVLRRLLPELMAEGYGIVTVTELLASGGR